MSKDVVVDLRRLKRFNAELVAGLEGTAHGPIRRTIHQWAKLYFTFILRRFKKYSRGGGDWSALDPKTVARRRKGKGKARIPGVGVAILVDTGTLESALAPEFIGAPGQHREDIPYGIRVGFGGPTTHPKKGKATIAEIAGYHQFGKGHLPVREIIVEPSAEVVRRMARLMARTLEELASGRA